MTEKTVAAKTRIKAGTTIAVLNQVPGVVESLEMRGFKSAGLGMNRDNIWAIAEGLGTRPLGLVSVDDYWSVFRAP